MAAPVRHLQGFGTGVAFDKSESPRSRWGRCHETEPLIQEVYVLAVRNEKIETEGKKNVLEYVMYTLAGTVFAAISFSFILWVVY